MSRRDAPAMLTAAAVWFLIGVYFNCCTVYGVVHSPWWTPYVFLAFAFYCTAQAVLFFREFKRYRERASR